MRRTAAFTLTELLVALGVGLIVLNVAFVVFVNTGKFFKRIESVGTKEAIAQSAILWTITKDTATNPLATNYPIGIRQFRKLGVFAIDNSVATHYKITIDELNNGPGDKAVIQPVNIFLPKAY